MVTMVTITFAFHLQVEQMLAKPETLDNLIENTPGLDEDPVAMG